MIISMKHCHMFINEVSSQPIVSLKFCIVKSSMTVVDILTVHYYVHMLDLLIISPYLKLDV